MITTIFIICFMLVSFQSHAIKITYPESITVFSNDNYHIKRNIKIPSSTQIKIINLDNMRNLDKKLSMNLPSNHEAAKKAFSKILNSKQWPAISEKIKLAAFDVAKAAQYSLKKIPAIIFNEKDVIYGVTDLREALILYTKSKRNHK